MPRPKDIIRSEVAAKRSSQEETDKKDKDDRIKETLLSLQEFNRSKNILLYVSVRGEVDTHSIISSALEQGKRVLVPFVANKNNMKASEITNMDDLSPGAFKIPEPVSRKEVPLYEIDLVIVPGVAFDSQGNRLGHGAGFYDKFLKDVRHARFVALAYDFQVVSSVPATKSDVRVHKIITESRIIECR